MAKLLALWSGDLALSEAFWAWAVTQGLLINIVTSSLFLILIFQDLFASLTVQPSPQATPSSAFSMHGAILTR